MLRDRAPEVGDYSAEDVAFLVANQSSFVRLPEPFLCWAGLSCYYFLNTNSYPVYYRGDQGRRDLSSFLFFIVILDVYIYSFLYFVTLFLCQRLTQWLY